MATTNSSKRRRRSPPSPPPEGQPLQISDLPELVLANVAKYLQPPSRAIFASVFIETNLANNNSQQPSTKSNAILSGDNSCECLDFADIEKSLASRLTDDDIAAALVCTVDNLKTLKLAGCTNITGSGLEPLRESLVLEHIDLTLVSLYENPSIDPEPLISEELVLPILISIVDANNNLLRYVELPKKFRSHPSSSLNRFLKKYNQLLKTRGYSCSNCDTSISTGRTAGNQWTMYSTGKRWIKYYGTQSFTCSKCTSHICDNCNDPEGNHSYIEHCESCERDYCLDCSNMKECPRCANYTCTKCAVTDMMDCQKCNREVCTSCIYVCECCSQKCCLDCADDEKELLMHRCNDCSEALCFSCRYSGIKKSWRNACRGCLEMIGPTIDKKLGENL